MDPAPQSPRRTSWAAFLLGALLLAALVALLAHPVVSSLLHAPAGQVDSRIRCSNCGRTFDLVEDGPRCPGCGREGEVRPSDPLIVEGRRAR